MKTALNRYWRTVNSILLFFIAFIGQAQTVGISSGLNFGRFYDFRQNEGLFYKEYQAQFGYSLGLEVKGIPLDTILKMDVTLNYQNYGGQFLTRDGGLGGTTSTQGEITKHLIGIEVYPFHLNINPHFRWNWGISYSRLVHYNLSGTKSWWYGNGSTLSSGFSDLNDIDHFVKPNNWGLISSLGYEFTIGKIKIEPSYSYFFGVSQEFNSLQASTSSMRHNVTISIRY